MVPMTRIGKNRKKLAGQVMRIRDGEVSDVLFGPDRQEVSADEAVVHFSVPARYFWDDIGFT